MNKKERLLKLFTQDISYNYHLVKTEEPDGHLIYLIKNGSEINTDTLEFSPTLIVESLIEKCSVKIEKFAPGIFFTEETNIEKLKYELNEELSENSNFSNFIESIKDEYRILEVKDSLLYKKDPKSYDAAKQKEHEELQKELWNDALAQLKEKKKQRNEAILAYNNDLIKLLKEYFEGIIEFEKRDFQFYTELEKILSNLIDPETWIKVDEQPFNCKIELISLEKDKLNVLLTDNTIHYTATLKFDKTSLITENILKINDLPKTLQDYDVLIKLYDIDTELIAEWEFKNDTDRFEYVIDYLVPIFKAEKAKKEKEFLDKMKEEEPDEFDDEEDINNNNNNMKNKKTRNPSDWYFDVLVPEDGPCDLEPSIISLSEDGSDCLDDQLGSHNLPQPIIDALNRAGIFGDSEMMEAVWEVNDSETKTKEDIIESMKKEGFNYVENMLGQ